jgi:MFS family permease
MVCSFLLCIPLAGYYQQARNYVSESKAYFGAQTADVAEASAADAAVGQADALPVASPTFTMSFGQMSEIVFMLIMPWFFVRLGVKNMLAIGMLAWVVRYGLFAYAAEDKVFWMILLGVLLHGICYDFFFVTGMIYSDKKATKDIRAQAQGFLVLVTQGLGLGLGAKLFFANVLMNSQEGVADWYAIWITPAVFAGVVLIVFYALFWDRTGDK